ncbi:hypothetical protein BJ170DRAFT_641050 [Xylariales sp. AK1849]|nr:hypothetical protein BJ170DRAFT_641050 [Xylariales sp. AK1849]
MLVHQYVYPYSHHFASCGTFNTAFSLIDHERVERFQFLACSIQLPTDEHDVDIVIANFDLNNSFPNAQSRIYICRVKANVLLQAKQK